MSQVVQVHVPSDESAKQDSLQIIVPVYNEGNGILALYREILQAGIYYKSIKFVYDFEEDTTVPFIRELAGKDPRINGERNDYGRGALNALKWGFAHCGSGPVIVLMGDCSDDLSIISKMVAEWANGATVVAPSRYMPGGKQFGGGFLKSNLSMLAGRSMKMFGFPTADATNNYKLYDGEWLQKQKIESCGGFEVALELTYKAFCEGKKIVEFPSVWRDRTQGQSNFRLWKWLPHYLKWYLKAITLCIARKIGLRRV